MATPTLELGFLQYFSPIFIFLLVFVIVYAICQFTKLAGENKILHAIIAFLVSIVFLFSTTATTVVTFIAPWFTIMFIFILFMLIAYKLFGATDDQIKTVISKSSTLQYFVLAIGIIIALFGLGSAFGQNLLGFTEDVSTTSEAGVVEQGDVASGSYQQNLIATLFNPKILGMILLMVIAGFTIRAMTPAMKPDWPE
jgi:hypothetical protein